MTDTTVIPPAPTPTPPPAAVIAPPAPAPAPVVTPPAPTPAPTGEIPPAPAPAPPKTPTIADLPPTEKEVPPPTPADWPADWRQKMAAGDAKLLERLEKMDSPLRILQSWRAAEVKMSTGELKPALPTNATAEEVAKYRKAWGIPEAANGYDVNVGGGFTWGETDKPALDAFLERAHAANMTPGQVKEALGWYAQSLQSAVAAQSQKDENDQLNGATALQAEWGPEFRANLTRTHNYFQGNEGMWEAVMGARLADGTALGNVPDVMRFFADKSRSENPFSALVPTETTTPRQQAESRLEALNGMMKDRGSAYYRGPTSAALQAEWRQLYDMIETDKSRSGRAA